MKTSVTVRDSTSSTNTITTGEADVVIGLEGDLTVTIQENNKLVKTFHWSPGKWTSYSIIKTEVDDAVTSH